MLNLLRSLYLFLTDPLVERNRAYKAYFKAKDYERNLDKHFGKDAQGIFTFENNIKLLLRRESRLAEFILNHNFELAERKFLATFLKPGDVVLDIGANVGLFSLLTASCVGEKGRVYAFEPVKRVGEMFKENLRLNSFQNIELIEKGLSNSETELLINTSTSYDAWSTLANVNSSSESPNLDKQEPVALTTLDKWVAQAELPLNKISFVKIDVEGWEKFVVQGGEEFFSGTDALVLMEFDEKNAWAAGYLCHDLYEVMVKL